MDTLVFHYFSATGNTIQAVQRLAQACSLAGHRTELLPISLASLKKPPLALHTAVHVFAFPVLGFGPPDLVKRYIRRLSRVVTKETGLRAVVFATWGGHPFQALEETERMLRRRGWEVLMTGGASYPANWTQVSSAGDPETIARQCAQGDAESDAFIARLATRLWTGKPAAASRAPDGQPAPADSSGLSLASHYRRHPWLFRSGSLSLALTGLVQMLYNTLGRRLLGSAYVADRSCSGCGLCAKLCPAGTIRMRGARPAWGSNCLSCNRCINRCPSASIQVSAPILVLQTAINIAGLNLAIVLAPRIADRLMAGQALAPLAAFLVGLVLFILVNLVQIGPLTWLFQALARGKPLNGFASLSWTRGFRRYLAPAKPLKTDP